MTARERFQMKFEPEPTSGCWLWTGARDSKGYGQLWVDGAVIGAHRFSYTAHVGAFDPGLHVDHKCRNTSCVNPAHLEPVTVLENLMRGIPGQWVARTHCRRGHPFTEDNVYRNPAGRGRTCRRCASDYMRPYMRAYYKKFPWRWKKGAAK